jgi:hypothetical protein
MTLKLQTALTFIATFLFTIWISTTNAQVSQSETIQTEENGRFFTFAPITETEFRNAFNKNYNAPFVTEISDTLKLEKAFKSIEKTYNEDEKELAKSELCNSPRCLTCFKAYYPTLDLYLFEILDYHYAKASFVFTSTNKMASGYSRFRGDDGVMSKDGLWVGLERQDADNFLQMEIAKSSKRGVWSLFTFDFTGLDINEEEETRMFWADKNTIYIATRGYDQQNDKNLFQYYAIRFGY